MINYLHPDFSDLPGIRAVPSNYNRGNMACEHIDVSIITPYYNTGDLFVETFVSVVAQSLQNWEWVIVNDGSTDEESVARLKKLVSDDGRIKLKHQANAGPAAARNAAFNSSRGRYVCLLDSDDMIEPTYLEKCIWFLDSYPQFAFCNSYTVVFGAQEFLWTNGFERGKDFLHANGGPPISVIRRKAYTDAGGFDQSIRFGHEDWDFWLAMAKAGHWGYTLKEFLQWYRKSDDGRYAQIMRTGDTNAAFEALIHQKYASLDKQFPKPVRHNLLPFESIETKSSINNPLQENPLGRRIMFIIPWMVPGGADRVNLDLIEGLTSQGHEISICATLLADHQWEHQFSRFTPDIFILPNILHPSDYPRFLAYLVQSRQIDTVVIAGSTIGYQLLPFLRSVSPGVAFVDMCHVEEPHWLNGGHPRFGVGYQDMLDINIVTTKHLSDWMEERGANVQRIRVMYTGVRSALATRQAEVRDKVRVELDIPADIPVIVFAGRICEQKRPAMLAEILRTMNANGLIFRALVIGDGELRGQLEELLAAYNLTANVQMLGSVSHQKWLDILVASDIFLMPSQYEGISIALLEAMAAGVVPIVAKVGGQEEIVTPDAGVLIDHGENEPQKYLDAIRCLLSDLAELQHMSDQCKVLAMSKMSWAEMINNFLKLLDEAHQLKNFHPCHPVSIGFGREIASMALEYKRLGEAVNYQTNSINAQSVQYDDWEKQKEELLASNTWLVSQRDAWEKQMEELLAGNTWLDSQRNAWHKLALDREGQIAHLNKVIAVLEASVAENAQRIKDSRVFERLQDAETKIEEIFASKSWRVTEPLRALRKRFGKKSYTFKVL